MRLIDRAAPKESGGTGPRRQFVGGRGRDTRGDPFPRVRRPCGDGALRRHPTPGSLAGSRVSIAAGQQAGSSERSPARRLSARSITRRPAFARLADGQRPRRARPTFWRTHSRATPQSSSKSLSGISHTSAGAVVTLGGTLGSRTRVTPTSFSGESQCSPAPPAHWPWPSTPALVLAHELHLLLEAAPVAGDLQRPFRCASLDLIRRVEAAEVLADDVGRRVARDPLGAAVPGPHPALGIEEEDGVVGDGLDEVVVALVLSHQSFTPAAMPTVPPAQGQTARARRLGAEYGCLPRGIATPVTRPGTTVFQDLV
jgi:hypothetical protein